MYYYQFLAVLSGFTLLFALMIAPWSMPLNDPAWAMTGFTLATAFLMAIIAVVDAIEQLIETVRNTEKEPEKSTEEQEE